jgi:hypothetical protein
LVGILRPIVEAFVLPMLDTDHDLSLGGRIAFQLVSDQHARRSCLLLQQFTEQAFGGLLVASTQDEDIENEALLIDRTPEPVLLAGDGDGDLVQVPLIAAMWSSPADALGDFPAEFQAPLPDRLVCHRDTARRQHLFDHVQTQRESEIQPHRIIDELAWVAIAGIDRVRGVSSFGADTRPRYARQALQPLNLTVPQEAVRDAVLERWSNGQTEGQINKLKTLKRAMYGRAGVDLLRARMMPLQDDSEHQK